MNPNTDKEYDLSVAGLDMNGLGPVTHRSARSEGQQQVNPNDATNEELRDWLAWNLHHRLLDAMGPNATTDDYYRDPDPIPNTIDAAAKCLPDGLAWYCTEIEWKAHPIPTISATNTVCVARTDDEATDRFRLAVKAIMAMEEDR